MKSVCVYIYVQRHNNFVYVMRMYMFEHMHVCIFMDAHTYTFMYVNISMLDTFVLFVCCIMYLDVCINPYVWVYYCLYCVYMCLGICVYI